jgi:His/Glu/Gln/Arg/opine family amino acid ABC transporter permease subunit
MNIVQYSLPYLLYGFKNTILLSLIGLALSVLLGFFFSLCLISEKRVLKLIVKFYIKVFRNTPFMIQVYLAYYLPPSLGLHVNAVTVGLMILTLYEAAYMAVTFQMGFLAISKGQKEAAMALCIPYPVMIFRIIMPQMVKIIIPALTNQMILTVKDSSILSMITVAELTMYATQCASFTYMPFEVFLMAGLFYWGLNILIETATKWYEKGHAMKQA